MMNSELIIKIKRKGLGTPNHKVNFPEGDAGAVVSL